MNFIVGGGGTEEEPSQPPKAAEKKTMARDWQLIVPVPNLACILGQRVPPHPWMLHLTRKNGDEIQNLSGDGRPAPSHSKLLYIFQRTGFDRF